MTHDLPTTLQQIPLSWATTASHYFENEYGEYWIAKVENNRLLISGLDIGWDVLSLSYQEVIAIRDELLKGSKTINGKIFNEPEIFWVLSVIASSLIRFKQ